MNKVAVERWLHRLVKERQLICDKNDAYACLKSACEYAEAADGQFICHRNLIVERHLRRDKKGDLKQ